MRRPAPAVLERARQVRALILDVDGVLTDGRMVLSDRGDELKSFHTHDGIGIALARQAGLKVALVTGEKSTIAQARGAKLGVDDVVLGARRKAEAVAELLERYGLAPEAAAFMGDDLLDVPGLQAVGFAIAPADAVSEVRAIAHLVTRAPGGRGAAREAVETILRVQGVWQATVARFIGDHGGDPARLGLGGDASRRLASARARNSRNRGGVPSGTRRGGPSVRRRA